MEEGAELIVEKGGALTNNGTLTNNDTIDINGNLNGNGETTGVYAAKIDDGKNYFTLYAAVKAATTSGQTVRLLTTEEQAFTKAIPEGVTLVIDKDQTVNITDLTTVATSTGKIQVNASAALTVASDKMIGAGQHQAYQRLH